MSAAAVTDVAAVCRRRPLVAAKLLAREVASDAAGTPSLAFDGGGEVDRSLLAARFRVLGLERKHQSLLLLVFSRPRTFFGKNLNP